MTRRPPSVPWQGCTPEQADLLDRLDFYGSNGWARNPQAEVVMSALLGELNEAGLSLTRVKDAMDSIVYGKNALRQLDRWKRITGNFGP